MPLILGIVIEQCTCGKGDPHCNVVAQLAGADSTAVEEKIGEELKRVVVQHLREIQDREAARGGQSVVRYHDSREAKAAAAEAIEKARKP